MHPELMDYITAPPQIDYANGDVANPVYELREIVRTLRSPSLLTRAGHFFSPPQLRAFADKLEAVADEIVALRKVREELEEVEEELEEVRGELEEVEEKLEGARGGKKRT